MTKITKKGLEKAVKGTGGILQAIANNIGCSRVGLWMYLEKHPEQRKIVTDELEAMKDLAEGSLFSQVKDRQQWAVKYFLATKAKDRGYVERTESVVDSTVHSRKVFVIDPSAYEKLASESDE